MHEDLNATIRWSNILVVYSLVRLVPKCSEFNTYYSLRQRVGSRETSRPRHRTAALGCNCASRGTTTETHGTNPTFRLSLYHAEIQKKKFELNQILIPTSDSKVDSGPAIFLPHFVHSAVLLGPPHGIFSKFSSCTAN